MLVKGSTEVIHDRDCWVTDRIATIVFGNDERLHNFSTGSIAEEPSTLVRAIRRERGVAAGDQNGELLLLDVVVVP